MSDLVWNPQRYDEQTNRDNQGDWVWYDDALNEIVRMVVVFEGEKRLLVRYCNDTVRERDVLNDKLKEVNVWLAQFYGRDPSFEDVLDLSRIIKKG